MQALFVIWVSGSFANGLLAFSFTVKFYQVDIKTLFLGDVRVTNLCWYVLLWMCDARGVCKLHVTANFLFVCLCCIEEARCVRANTTTSPNVTAFVQGPNGQYFVPGKYLLTENEWPVAFIFQFYLATTRMLSTALSILQWSAPLPVQKVVWTVQCLHFTLYKLAGHICNHWMLDFFRTLCTKITKKKLNYFYEFTGLSNE